MAVIIEMLGAPGAGKTTLLEGIEDGCRAIGLTPFTIATGARPLAARTALGRAVCRSVPARFEHRALWVVFRIASGWHSLRAIVRQRDLARYVVISQRARPPAADARRRRVVYWYLRTMGSYSFLRARGEPTEAIVIDEGFVHRAVQLHASTVEVPTGTQVAEYVALLPRPDLVVHVSASPGACRRRVQERGVWTRLGHRSPEEIERFLGHAHDTVMLVRSELGRRGWPVLDVDNSGASADAAMAALGRAIPERLTRAEDGSAGRPR